MICFLGTVIKTPGDDQFFIVNGYFPRSLREIFPRDQFPTGALKNIYENFLDISAEKKNQLVLHDMGIHTEGGHW